MRRYISFLGGLAALLWTALPVSAQSAGQISGTVRDTTGSPLPGVAVTLRRAAAPAGQTVTDADGRFAFPRLGPAAYDLYATLTGFAPAHLVVVLKPGGEATVPVTLWVTALETTTVTAARTGDRDVQDVPIAISVLRGTDLQRVNAHTVEDVAGRAPSVTFSQNTGFGQLTIRGIGTNVVFAGSDPSSAVYVDGVYLARPAAVLSDFVDLDRVEVMRGPQGTLYGRNAVGGAMSVVTADPGHRFDWSARTIVGNVKTLRVEAGAGGPLIPNRLLASGTILRGFRQGAVRDLTHEGQFLGGEDVTAARGKLHVLFNPRADLLLSADVTHQDPAPLVYAKVLAVKPGFSIDNPPDLHEVRTSVPAWSRNVHGGGSARFTMRVGRDLTLTSLTAVRALDYELLVDGDITELDLTESHVTERHHQLSEEITLTHRGERLQWIAGAFLFREEDRQPTVVGLGGLQRENRLNPEVNAGSRALFGQATFGVTPRLSATAGLRYSFETKDIVNSGGSYPDVTPATPVPGTTYAYADRIERGAWTPKFAVEARLRDRVLAYASAARGFKTGGFNLTSTTVGRGYAPEWAWSYEGGLKTTTAGARVRVNLAVFYTDYSDLQVQTAIAPGVIDISNAAAATIRGVELETEARIAPALHAGGHVAWLDAAYDRYIAVGVGGVTGDVAGRRLTNAPEWSGRAWLEWTPAAGARGVLTLRAETRWQSTVYFTPFNDAVQRQRAYGVLDAAAEFRPARGCCTVGVFGRNLTGEDYITGTFSSPPPAIGGRPAPGREAGVQLILRR
jgi:iron complex outermembrane receptor protein